MRILHVSQATTAGVPNVVLALVRDQVRRGWDVSAACPADGYLADRARDYGATVLNWEATRQPGSSFLSEAVRLRRVVMCASPDLVHLHSAKAGLVGRLVLRGRLPTVFQPHAWSFHAVAGTTGRASAAWERWSARWADVIVAVSDDERDVGLRGGVDGAYRVIPNGIAVASFALVSAGEARAELGLSDLPTVVCVGRLCRQKGQDRLLRAWPEVAEQVPSAQLLLVGDGPDADDLMTQATGLAGVTFAGDRDDVGQWLRAADVVVLPSRWEAGLSLVAMEAMASGRSVVASEVAGVRSGLDTGAGEVVPQDDETELAPAIVRRLLDPERAVLEGKVGRAIVEERFEQQVAADQMASLYAQLTVAGSGLQSSGGVDHLGH